MRNEKFVVLLAEVNPLLKITVYLAVVLAIGVVVSPPAYWLCQWLIELGWLEIIRGFPFHRYFSRTVQVAGLVLLVPLVFWLRIRKLSELGIEPNPLRWKDVSIGFFLALVPMLALGAGYLAADIYKWQEDPNWWKLFRIVGTAGAVSVLEEIFFRGVLLGLAVRSFGTMPGVAFSSIVFAGLHFMRPARIDDGSPVTWSSGLEQLGMLFGGAPPMPVLAYGIITLLLVGVLLAWVTLRTRSLWLAIGLHAGWILGQQGFLLAAKYRIKPPDELLPWVGPNVVSGAVPTGVIPLLVLCLTGFFLWLWLRQRSA